MISLPYSEHEAILKNLKTHSSVPVKYFVIADGGHQGYQLVCDGAQNKVGGEEDMFFPMNVGGNNDSIILGDHKLIRKPSMDEFQDAADDFYMREGFEPQCLYELNIELQCDENRDHREEDYFKQIVILNHLWDKNEKNW